MIKGAARTFAAEPGALKSIRLAHSGDDFQVARSFSPRSLLARDARRGLKRRATEGDRKPLVAAYGRVGI
jgi:hypothetical protein